MHLLIIFMACGSSHQSSTAPPKNVPKEDRPSEHEAIEQPRYGVFFANQQSLNMQKTPRNLSSEEQALVELYKGPTAEEKEAGLVFLSCGSTGARLLSIQKALATVQLEGECGGCGAVGVYDSIVSSLKQFPTVSYVHLLDADGQTQAISKTQDARPACLEP